MNKRLTIWITLFFLTRFCALAQNNLSPLARGLAQLGDDPVQWQKARNESCGSYCLFTEGRYYLSGTISWSARPDFQFLAREGIKIRTEFQFGATVLIPENRLVWLGGQPWLTFLDLDQPKEHAMREQRLDLRADLVQLGSGDLDKAYNGENVVVAIIDQGFDYSHPAFWDSTYTNTHILFAWDQMATSGTPPNGYTYGKIVAANQLKAESGDTYYKSASHGTHVAAIATGSGYPTENRSFRGIAPKANVILISSDLSDSKVSDGLRFAAAYAKSKNMPLAVNMSFGGYGSALDGTSFLDKAINEQVGPGCLVTTAIGNEGDLFQFATFTSDASQTTWKSIISAPSGYQEKSFFQVWGNAGSSATVRMGLVNSAGVVLWTSNALSSSTASFSVPATSNWSFKFSTYGSYSASNRSLWHVELSSGESGISPFVEVIPHTPGETFQVVSPYMNLSNQLSGNVLDGFSKGDTVSNGRSPGMTCARSVSVGAHVAKDTLFPVGKPRLIDKGVVLGQLCDFSSRGPSFSGLVKPDVSAPGYLICSALSSSDVNYPNNANTDKYTEYKAVIDGKTYRYFPFYGTSMATPMVTGGLALLLQANPLLTPEQAKEVLSETSRKDVFTQLASGAKNNRFGFGKLDLYKAMLKTLNITPSVPMGSDLLMFPNPSSSTVSLVLPDESIFEEIRLFNLLGQEVIRSQGLSGSFLSFSVADVRQGQYMLQIQTNKGKILRRILVSR